MKVTYYGDRPGGTSLAFGRGKPPSKFRPGDPGNVHGRPAGPLIGENPPLPPVARQGSP